MPAIFQNTIFRIAAVVVLILLVVIVVLGLGLKDSLKREGVLAGQVSTLTQTNKDNAREYAAALAQAKQNADIANTERDRERARAQTYQETLDAIQHAPASDVSAVSPVVRDTVARLWDTPPSHP